MQQTYLITGAGSGLGKGLAFGLAHEGKHVIATVETLSEVSSLILEAENENLSLQVEKLDITDAADRQRFSERDIDVLVNNAGIAFAAAMLDIPEHMLREQFEVNVFATILLTQVIGRLMLKRRSGRIIFISSVHGLMADPLSGPYCASKFALEAFAESMAKEVQEFNIQVQVINPGPFQTGFNDVEYEAYKRRNDEASDWLFDYERMSFPYKQLNPKKAIKDMIKSIGGQSNDYRICTPKAIATVAKKRQKELWNRKTDRDLGKRHELIEKALDS